MRLSIRAGKVYACAHGIVLRFGLALMLCALVPLSAVIAAAGIPSASVPPVFLPYLPAVGSATPAHEPSWSAPIAVSPRDGSIWVVNPDAGSITALQPGANRKLFELPVGREPWSLAIAPDGGTVYVVDRASGTLVVVDAKAQRVRAHIALGPEPGGIALSPDGTTAYVTVTSAGTLLTIDLARLSITKKLAVGPLPYAVAFVPGNGADDRLFITHFLAVPRSGGAEATDDGHAGHISVVDVGAQRVINDIVLASDEHGFPNMLAGIAVWGTHAFVPEVRAAPALPNTLTTTVFAAVSTLDLAAEREDARARLNLNDQDVFGSPVNNPVAAIPAPDGTRLYVVLAGSNVIEIIDIHDLLHPHLLGFIPTGKNPRGMALSSDGRWGYVMSFLSRTVTVIDLVHATVEAQVAVTGETLPADVLRGKVLFNTATDPRLAQAGWMSCASCHADGGTDGVTWMFPDGPRQTPPIWNAASTLPWHWSAALDEAQDVEDTIQRIQLGIGLAPGPDPPLLGHPLAGRSSDLDALAAYLQRGIRTPAAPPADGDTADGRRLFEQQGCALCHGGPSWTSSHLPGAPGTLDPDGNGMIDGDLRDVGTLDPRDVRGATGFDPPSLLNIGLTAPYLHNGAMPSLTALLASGHPRPGTGASRLSPVELAQLVAFLKSIGATTPPVSSP